MGHWNDAMATEPIVQIRGLCKSFAGVRALDNAQFELLPGEVHALMGENGAGKSTLMKVLAGVYPKDAGEIVFEGRPVDIASPRAALALGIGIIHQELNLMNHLSAAQNIFIGREPRQGLGLFVDEAAMRRNAQAVFERINLRLDPDTPVGELTVARQQMVEIAKALTFHSRVLIMDEPTAALNDQEVATRPMASTPMEALIAMMVGRQLAQLHADLPDTSANPVVLEARGITRGDAVRDASFVLRRGEILGFAGLMGAGRTELARAVFGADPIDAGEVRVHGRKVSIRSPGDAVAHGIGYLSEDRKQLGLAVGMDVESNIALASMRKFLSLGFFVDRAALEATGARYVRQLQIKTPSVYQPVRLLSGGNQQKIVVAKWLLRDCGVLFFDEPTRGIDVGAKAEIYRLLHALAEEGKAIVIISSELPEILRVCHRVLVMCEGRITGELAAHEATQEKIMHLATRREGAAASDRQRLESPTS
jgi:ribose transport system ATP-binding protein